MDPCNNSTGRRGRFFEQRQQLEESLGGERPAGERYITWLKALVRGDFGQSLLYPPPCFGHHWGAVCQFSGADALRLAVSGLIGFGLGCAMGTTRDRLPTGF